VSEPRAATAAATGHPGRTRLHIDWTRCEGRGLCVELLPELLDDDPWGYPRSASGPEPEVPARLAEHAERAVARCPRLALTLRPGR
jgi:ferredoxin